MVVREGAYPAKVGQPRPREVRLQIESRRISARRLYLAPHHHDLRVAQAISPIRCFSSYSSIRMSTTSTPNDSPATSHTIQPLHNPSNAAHVSVPQAPLGNATNGPVKPFGAKAMFDRRFAKQCVSLAWTLGWRSATDSLRCQEFELCFANG